MRRFRFLSVFLLLVILLAACASPTPAPSAEPQPVLPSDPFESRATETPGLEGGSASGGGFPAAAFAAQKALAEQLALPLEVVKITNVEPVDWPDSCLGAGGPEEACLQVITPGYRVTLTVDAAEYVYHTDAQGSSVRRGGKPTVSFGGEQAVPLLVWTSPACEVLTVNSDALFFGSCNGELRIPEYPTGELLSIARQWAETFASFEAETPAGKVVFSGIGANIATEAEQRMMAEWARLNFEAAQSGRTGAAWGLALAWHREGGIAGFCDDVTVYLNGMYFASSCKGDGLSYNGWLTASQLELVYAWVDTYAPIDDNQSDPAVADAMTVTLTLPGTGTTQADEATIQAIGEFAAGLQTQQRFSVENSAEAAETEEILRQFLQALNSGDFILGAKLYGGDLAALQGWNPDITDDLPKLLERGCTQNGLQCLLPRAVTYRGPDARNGHQFFVEFNNPDGSLFRQMGEQTSFLFSVVKNGDNWQVMELPPYVP